MSLTQFDSNEHRQQVTTVTVHNTVFCVMAQKNVW